MHTETEQDRRKRTDASPRRPPLACDRHRDQAAMIDAPAPGRRGWIRTTCRHCGGFIGYRPTEAAESDLFRKEPSAGEIVSPETVA